MKKCRFLTLVALIDSAYINISSRFQESQEVKQPSMLHVAETQKHQHMRDSLQLDKYGTQHPSQTSTQKQCLELRPLRVTHMCAALSPSGILNSKSRSTSFVKKPYSCGLCWFVLNHIRQSEQLAWHKTQIPCARILSILFLLLQITHPFIKRWNVSCDWALDYKIWAE